jgi:flagellar hook-associated protein FlgK
VREDIMANPGERFAVSMGAGLIDNESVSRMIAVGEDSYSELSNTSIQNFYRGVVTGVGQAVVVREARTSGLESVMAQLNSQRDDISGVDLNEETAKLISLERMFQGMARVISAQDEAMGELMDLL